MSFFGAIEFANRSKPPPRPGPVDQPVKADLSDNSSSLHEKMEEIKEEKETSMSYPLCLMRPDSSKRMAEIHSVTTELEDFNPEKPPNLINISPSYWTFEGNQQLKISSDTYKPKNYKTSSPEFDEFISEDMAYGILSIQDEQMMLEEVLHENMKSLKPVLPIHQDPIEPYQTRPVQPERQIRAIPAVQAVLFTQTRDNGALHEEKMVELEEAAGFDIDDIDSDAENHNREGENLNTVPDDEDLAQDDAEAEEQLL